MARWPNVPGGGVKGMNNPIYWTRFHNQNERSKNSSLNAKQKAIEDFNERWNRLCLVHKEADSAWEENYGTGTQISINITTDSNRDLDESEIEKIKNKLEKRIKRIVKLKNEAEEMFNYINNNITSANKSDLSKYSTKVKKFAVESIDFLIETGQVNHESVHYCKDDKSIYIDDERYYCLS